MNRPERCKWCSECTNDWKDVGQIVTVSEKDVLIRDMMNIFKFPEEVIVEQEDRVCVKCIERLELCYQFYGTFMAAQAETRNLSAIGKISEQDTSLPCGICDMSFETELELEKHMKIQHSQSNNPFYHCQTCQKSFKTNRGRQQHNMMYHESTESYSCHVCDRSFITKTNYENHMRHHRDFVCHFCNGGWIGEAKLLEHVRSTHMDRRFVCRWCDKKERLKKCLNRHLRSVHQQTVNPFYCGHCGVHSTLFDSYDKLTDHLQVAHAEEAEDEAKKEPYDELLRGSLFTKELPHLAFPEPGVMDKDQELFLQYFHLIRNAQERHDNTPRPTESRLDRRMVLEDFLDEAFENDEIWNKYIENGEEYLIDDYDFYLSGIAGAPEQESSMYRCPRCQQGFQKQLDLTVHLAENHDVPSLVCNDCGVSFKRLRDYRTHRNEHLKENVRFRESNIPEVEEALSLVQSTPLEYSVREEETGYRFTCNLCDRTFQRKHNLEKHSCRFYERHGREDEILRCDHCPFRYNSSKELDNHHCTHRSESSLASQETIYCMLCDRRFSTTAGLKYHLKRHTGIKAFTCLYCGKKFTANSNLSAHIRNVHSERKDHRCTDCGEAFATKDHLNKHYRSRHRQERTFRCPECDKSYLQRSHLNDHVAACHRDERYVCSTCNESYGCKRSLKRHQQRKHGILAK